MHLIYFQIYLNVFQFFKSAVYVVTDIPSNDSTSTSVEQFINTSLIQTIMNIIPPASSLGVCDPPSPQIKLVMNDIGNILYYCGKLVKNIEKLFNCDYIPLFLKTFEMIANEREKGKAEFNTILHSFSIVFFNSSLEFSDMPNSNNENSLFPNFQKNNTIERLNNLFVCLNQINSPSEFSKEYLNYLALFVCFFFHGQTPLMSSGPVLEY
jgi:hypothetical protein